MHIVLLSMLANAKKIDKEDNNLKTFEINSFKVMWMNCVRVACVQKKRREFRGKKCDAHKQSTGWSSKK